MSPVREVAVPADAEVLAGLDVVSYREGSPATPCGARRSGPVRYNRGLGARVWPLVAPGHRRFVTGLLVRAGS